MIKHRAGFISRLPILIRVWGLDFIDCILIIYHYLFICLFMCICSCSCIYLCLWLTFIHVHRKV
ncbi:hypothetical protein T484DRAFT_1649893 [Baffinella frigidus]|nr:hypothetical protein T484DRAFT_1649893 [Cryptophyta sp. CCMP2293]